MVSAVEGLATISTTLSTSICASVSVDGTAVSSSCEDSQWSPNRAFSKISVAVAGFQNESGDKERVEKTTFAAATACEGSVAKDDSDDADEDEDSDSDSDSTSNELDEESNKIFLQALHELDGADIESLKSILQNEGMDI